MSADLVAAARAFMLSCSQRTAEDQLAALMVEMRALGIDVMGAARRAEIEIARLGLDVDVPVTVTKELRIVKGDA